MSSKRTLGSISLALFIGVALSISQAAIATAEPLSLSGNFEVAPSISSLGSSSNSHIASSSNLDCQGSGELSGVHPGWSSNSAVQITLTMVKKSIYRVYWCPATAPNGEGTITYTVSSLAGGASCVTTATDCQITGITSQAKLIVMAADQTGSNTSATKAIQSNGMIDPCLSDVNVCNTSKANLTFSNYGNDSVSGL